jgi:sugar-specific transcriptional regulator TrmB
MLTSFYSVFEQKLKNQKIQLKEELAKAKSDRRKACMKQQIAEAKDMRNHLREMKAHMKPETVCCPKCGHEF